MVLSVTRTGRCATRHAISLGVASSLVRNGGNGQLLLDASVVGAGLVFGLSRFQFK